MEILPSLVPAALLTIPFVVSVLALHFIIFRPLFDYLEEREGISSRARTDAAEMNAAADEKLVSIEQQLIGARKEATELKQAARANAHVAETAILAEARRQADVKVGEAIQQIGIEKARASATLRGTASVLSTDIAARVLGRQPA